MREVTEHPGVLELLAEHESAIKDLYEAFAEAFPSLRQLFSRIAAEEDGHANMLRALHSRGAGIMDVAYSRFKPQAVSLSIEFVKEKTDAARTGALSAVQALAIARELESALLETNFFKVETSAPAALRPIFDRLAEETRDHLALVTEALESARG